ncbi:hypothetical protein [Limnoglobus roseus]|uniref:Uncharacterized protein n=1 Tax=Limnoglobus roseus TaxID=2598579 RepID=A0A5C1AFK2_9BACT|nr:hypothetical protein [Limnoglobus roseus]QEL15768.1 hypothetical protein PX52LOC_02704 [Limnoglobus roseus]
MADKDIRAEFDRAADEWQKHCKSVAFSSNINDYLDDPTYKKVVALGTPAIPHIIERYKKDSLPWGFVLQDITGEQFIPDKNKFSPAEVKKKWLEWWAKRS